MKAQSIPRKGEIYFADLDPVEGREQAGRRPVVVLSLPELASAMKICLAVPGTKGENVTRDYAYTVRVPAGAGGLKLETVFLSFHLRAIDLKRLLLPPIGILPGSYLRRIERALIFLCDIDPDDLLEFFHGSPRARFLSVRAKIASIQSGGG